MNPSFVAGHKVITQRLISQSYLQVMDRERFRTIDCMVHAGRFSKVPVLIVNDLLQDGCRPPFYGSQ
jgi:hypothetical protein